MIIKYKNIYNLKILTVYSSISYFLSYTIVLLVSNISTAFIASLFNIKTYLTYNNLLFITKDNSDLWNIDIVIFVFGFATVLLFIIALLIYRLFIKKELNENFVKVFLFWFILHCINRIFGSFIWGIIFKLYYSNVILNWFLVEKWLKIFLMIFTSLLLIATGVKSRRLILFSANSFNLVILRKRNSFYKAQVINTWLISSIFIFIFNILSLNLYENLFSISMLVIIISAKNFRNIITPESDNMNEEPVYIFPTVLLIISLVIVFIYISLFYKGFYFN